VVLAQVFTVHTAPLTSRQHQRIGGRRVALSSDIQTPSRRLEDRIRTLSARLATEKGPCWIATIAELKALLREHGLRLANRALAALGRNIPPIERRGNGNNDKIQVLPALEWSRRKKRSPIKEPSENR
jgi:hypothetical protein